MAIDTDSPAPPVVPLKQSTPHPFAPLTASEISIAAAAIRTQWPENTEFHYKCVTLLEPPKADVIPVLEAERTGTTCSPIPRTALVAYYLKNTNRFHEAKVDLPSGKVLSNVRLGKNLHGAFDGSEIQTAESIALSDEGVKREIAKLKLPEGAVVVCDPWTYGSDGVNDDDRLIQCWLYMRDPQNASEKDSNHYAFPLPLSPVIDVTTWKVIRIEHLPTGAGSQASEPSEWKHRPANEYIPELQQPRSDLKPLHVIQPEGASFRVTEQGTSNVIDWQKWSFRVGFNHREGMVLYNVTYDNRSLFYRVSLSDMNIPYADGRPPFHRKSAFDLGDAGAGIMANNLKLGCDCLGSIHYLSGTLSDSDGKPFDTPNVVCVHEQDAGIGWKHTNYRTGRAALVRQRELVLQSILTVANYEYVLMYIFNQAGEFHYEVRATGILSTQPIDDDVEVPWGTIVHPGVLASHHQHIFSLRIDPAIDGHDNRLVYSEAHPVARDSRFNPHGNGYRVDTTLVQQSGGFNTDPSVNRVYKIQNNSVRNPINGQPVGYKIMTPPFQKILSDHDSFNYKRAEFSDRDIYAVRYRDHELYAGGWYTNQSRGGTGVRSWAERRDDIVDTDLVVFVQFGINHVPRIEDFPVMPCETLRIMLKPVNFFTKNPALDVPASNQAFNKSVLLGEAHRQATGNGLVVDGSSGDACCATNDTAGTNGTNGTNGANGVH